MSESKDCTVCTFSLGEKLLIRTTFVLSILLGAVGIWMFRPGVAVAYLAYAVVSYFGLMRYTVCSRCPHLFQANDCLFLPVGLAKRFVLRREGELTAWERLLLDSAVIGTAVIPLFWLISVPMLLVLYVLVTVGCGVAIVKLVCSKKCRVDVCPLNKRMQPR